MENPSLIVVGTCMPLCVSLLGHMMVRLDQGRICELASKKAQALLAYLAVEGARPHYREALSGLLWPDSPEASARGGLRQALLQAVARLAEIMIADPLSIPAVVDRLPDVDELHFNDADVLQHELVHKIADHLGPDRCATMPTSVVISKADMVQRALGPFPEYDRPEATSAEQMSTDIRELDAVVRGKIWPLLDEPALDSAVRRFPLASFHLVAALGTLPDASAPVIVDGESYMPIVGEIRPSRIVDPLFNILSAL